MVDAQLLAKARAYVAGQVSLDGLEHWLAGIDLDASELNTGTREMIGLLRLLCVEAQENIRDEQEIRDACSEIVSTRERILP